MCAASLAVAPLPICSPLSSARGHWEIAGAHPRLVAWRPPVPCTAFPWREALANRHLVFIGDSVSRYVFWDLSWALLSCPALPTAVLNGPPIMGAALEPPPALTGDCDALFTFMFRHSHGDLGLHLPERNLTLSFLWLAHAHMLPAVTWADELLGGGRLGGARAPDAVFLSLGYWDVSGERRAQLVDWGSASTDRHCEALRNMDTTFRDVYLQQHPALPTKLIIWGTPYSEPYVNPHWGHSALIKFPPAKLDAVNGCTEAWSRGLGLRYLNTSTLLRAPPGAFAQMLADAGEGKPADADGRLLTIDGYHPAPPSRAALLDELLNSAAVLGSWGETAGWKSEPRGLPEGLGPPALPRPWHVSLLRSVGYGRLDSVETWVPFFLCCLLGATAWRAAAAATATEG